MANTFRGEHLWHSCNADLKSIKSKVAISENDDVEKDVKLFNFCIASCVLTRKKIARKLRCMSTVLKNTLRDLLQFTRAIFLAKIQWALGIILELNQDFFVHRLPASQLLTSFPMDFPPTFPFLPHSEPKANRRRCSLPSTTWKARRSCPSRSDVGLSSTTR